MIVANYQVGESHALLGQWLHLTYVQNRGAAFGIMPGQSWFFLTAALIVIIGLMYYNLRYSVDRLVQIMMGLIVAGALGNFIDRIRLRYVIDFFDLGWWPVFNIADMLWWLVDAYGAAYVFFHERGLEKWVDQNCIW